jgi:tRNA (guanine37-N1)-methyltransferase
LELARRNVLIDEVLMNLPQSAYEFVDVFIGYHHRYNSSLTSSLTLPRIHVYAFSTATDPIEDVIRRVASIMQCSVDDMNYQSVIDVNENKKRGREDDSEDSDRCHGHIVRDVAPRKVMICLSFRLPISVAKANPIIG